MEQSIKGLWIAAGNEGYLASWFPRLRTSAGRLIPLSPGINVFYGLNGAGKSQMLEAIAYAADYKMSAYEGFVLHNPIVSAIQTDFYTDGYVFDISPEELLSRYKSMDTEELWLGGWTQGFDPGKVTTQHRELVLGILAEFISSKNGLLTREAHSDGPGPGDPSKMNSPGSVQIVPMIFSTDEAPLTRIHIQEIRSSFLEFSVMIESRGSSGEDPELSMEEMDRIWETERNENYRLFVEWIGKWAWSPLINLRNFPWDFEAGIDETEVKLWSNENLPIFLPSIISYDSKPEYEEFSSSISGSVSLSLTRESEIDPSPNYFSHNRRDYVAKTISTINPDDLGCRNIDHNGATIDGSEFYRLLAKYLETLRSKLIFLPNFRGLFAEQKQNSGVHILKFSNHVKADFGSTAERRWLKLARETMRTQTQWVVVDEPEAGLHRTAEADLVSALSSSEWNRGSVIVIATHSPEFLDIPDAHILHIDGGIVRELTQIDREDLIALGLRPGDLLTQIRIFLLVEGEHERIIFENMFKEELRRARCKIIVARGAKNMKDIFESQMIFNFSDATILSLLDNVHSAEVHSIWTEAKKLANSGKLIESGQYVRSALPRDKSGENVFLSQFLTLALSYGQYERVEVWGLSKPDIVQYFEPSCFRLTKSWEELNATHTTSDPSFKVWASKKYGADFDIRAIDAASRSLDSIPDEFGDLIMRISELSRGD